MAWWDLKSWRLGGRSRFFGNSIVAALAPDGRTIALSGDGQRLGIKLWATGAGQVEATLLGHLDTPTTLAFSPDGRTLVTGGEDGQLKLWHLRSRRTVANLLQLPGEQRVQTAVFSPDGTWLGVCDSAGGLHFFSAPPPTNPPEGPVP